VGAQPKKSSTTFCTSQRLAQILEQGVFTGDDFTFDFLFEIFLLAV
jgi:hypothetical protein